MLMSLRLGQPVVCWKVVRKSDLEYTSSLVARLACRRQARMHATENRVFIAEKEIEYIIISGLRYRIPGESIKVKVRAT